MLLNGSPPQVNEAGRRPRAQPGRHFFSFVPCSCFSFSLFFSFLLLLSFFFTFDLGNCNWKEQGGFYQFPALGKKLDLAFLLFHVLGGRIHISEFIGNMLLLTPLAWSPLQASFDTLRVMIDDGNDVPAAFRATTKKLEDVGSVGIRLDNTWIYKSKIQKWVYLCLLPTSRPVILITGTEEFSCWKHIIVMKW